MQGGETSVVVHKGLANRKSVRKSVEKFVPWKKSIASNRGGDVTTPESTSTGKGKNKGMELSSSSGPPKSPRVSNSGNFLAGAEGGDVPRRSFGRERQQSPASAHQTEMNGRNARFEVFCTNASRVAAIPANASRAPTNAGGTGTPSCGGRDVLKGKECSSTSPTSMRSMHEEIFTRNREHRFFVLQGVQYREGHINQRTPTAHCSSVPKAGRTFSSSKIGIHEEQDCRERLRRSPTVEDVEEPSGEHEEDYRDDGIQPPQSQQQSKTHALVFFKNDSNENDMTKNEDDGDAIVVRERAIHDDVHSERNVQDLLYPTEVERKKERRQERAWLEKEGDRRRKEGLPQNFLLMDEQTKKPYSGGVEDWRKELMLLSRDLDPAIGNINKQPEGAIAEIAEWIQQTWEYSSPVKFEFIKEVIARGVTLRRVELWNKIRNGEAKPKGISDRTWRTLERQLDNPTSIRKSENCRRANASRVNFGRTGPSGEVGVRHRLRRILRRSPDPEEVRFEMERDKGFGSRQQRKESNSNVMHGSGRQRRSSMDVSKSNKLTGNFEEDIRTDTLIVTMKSMREIQSTKTA